MSESVSQPEPGQAVGPADEGVRSLQGPAERRGLRRFALLPLLLLAGLVGLQLQQAFARFGSLRDRQRVQFLNAVERMNAEVASAVEGDLARRRERVTAFAGLVDVGLSEARRVEGLQALCARDPECLAARFVLASENGLEAERDEAVPIAWDAEAGRLTLRAAVTEGTVVFELAGAPLFARVSEFQPIEGVANTLVDPGGAVVAVDEVGRELGITVGDQLAARFPVDIVEEVLGGNERVRAGGARLFTAPIASREDRPLFLHVSVVPDAALAEKEAPAQRETRAILLVTLASTAGLVLAGVWLQRAAARERELQRRSERLEEERRLAARLATSERLSALGLLTAGVAHEINNPLEGIGNYVTLLGEESLPAERRAAYLERVQHGLERIARIVRELLGFARPGVRGGAFDLRAAALRAVDLARLAPSVKGCQLELAGLFEPGGAAPPLFVEGDAGGIEQVVLNLLVNAGRASEGSGPVVVRLERAGACARLVVEDEGHGILPEDLPRLFDPFFTRTGSGAIGGRPEDGGRNEVESGVGLGLSISYSIVQSHGGELLAANRSEGRGARFEVLLPLAPDGDAAVGEVGGGA